MLWAIFVKNCVACIPLLFRICFCYSFGPAGSIIAASSLRLFLFLVFFLPASVMMDPDFFVCYVIFLPDTAITHILGIFLFLFCAALLFVFVFLNKCLFKCLS